MPDTRTSTQSHEHTNGPTRSSPEQEREGQGLNPDQELVYRLKNAIDQRGRYSFRLNDMAAGMAAGRNISTAEARRTIEEKFLAQTGRTPQEYLDHHYEQRRQNGRGNDHSQTMERENGYSRGR